MCDHFSTGTNGKRSSSRYTANWERVRLSRAPPPASKLAAQVGLGLWGL